MEEITEPFINWLIPEEKSCWWPAFPAQKIEEKHFLRLENWGGGR